MLCAGRRFVVLLAAVALVAPAALAQDDPPSASTAARRPLRVLATGDSMIQIVDGLLAQRLGRGARVRSDAHVSTGLSKSFLFDWPRHARAVARAEHPDATVVFLGANDGFAMRTPHGKTVACCRRAWVAEYARRVAALNRDYARRGAGRVYWMLLPVPGRRSFARVFRAVNAAIRAAARGNAHVRLLDVGRIVAPGGRFRHAIRRDGHTVTVRQPDAIHLSVGGARIAASLIADALRRDGLVG